MDPSAWPGDADGDVMRRLLAHGFDFSRKHTIDFNVDFATWPPPDGAMDAVRTYFGNLKVVDPDEDGSGYLLGTIDDLVTYDLVMRVQRELSALVEPFAGVCESWGVMQDPRA
jgi:hypothetical protein